MIRIIYFSDLILLHFNIFFFFERSGERNRITHCRSIRYCVLIVSSPSFFFTLRSFVNSTCTALFLDDRRVLLVSISHPSSSLEATLSLPRFSFTSKLEHPSLFPEATSHPFIQPPLFFVLRRRGSSCTLKVHHPSNFANI